MDWPSPAGAAVGVAAAAALFAAFQAFVAWRKLSFDLFTKRFETWDALNNAIDARRDVLQQLRVEAPDEGDGGESRRRFWRLRLQMALLFPPEVDRCIGRVEAALQEYALTAIARERVYSPSAEAAKVKIEIYDRYAAAASRTYSVQSELMNVANPYMRQYGLFEEYGVPALRWLKVSVRQLRRRKPKP